MTWTSKLVLWMGISNTFLPDIHGMDEKCPIFSPSQIPIDTGLEESVLHGGKTVKFHCVFPRFLMDFDENWRKSTTFGSQFPDFDTFSRFWDICRFCRSPWIYQRTGGKVGKITPLAWFPVPRPIPVVWPRDGTSSILWQNRTFSGFYDKIQKIPLFEGYPCWEPKNGSVHGSKQVKTAVNLVKLASLGHPFRGLGHPFRGLGPLDTPVHVHMGPPRGCASLVWQVSPGTPTAGTPTAGVTAWPNPLIGRVKVAHQASLAFVANERVHLVQKSWKKSWIFSKIHDLFSKRILMGLGQCTLFSPF